MDRLTAFVASAANFGRWARDLVVLGVTMPLDEPHRTNVVAPMDFHPHTGRLMIVDGFDTAGTPEGCLPDRGLVDRH
jgi:hypothetical protein